MADLTPDITLTDEERKFILEEREKRRESARQRSIVLSALEAAAAYEKWLQLKERCGSFSTFVNEFGGDAALYQLVETIRVAATRVLSNRSAR